MNTSRLLSVDAFRGLTVAAMLLVNNAGDWNHVYPWLEHAAWHGLSPADFIFPFFLFIVGVSLQLAIGPQLGTVPAATLLTPAWLRAGRIVLLGIALHLVAMWLIPGREFRLLGVLQRIGLCFGLLATLVLLLPTVRRQWLALLALLAGYGALLLAGGSLAPLGNIVTVVDNAVLGPLAYSRDAASGIYSDPEGILGTLGALASCLLGWLAGERLRARDTRALLTIAAGGIALGLALHLAGLPLNKQLWTPSFALLTGGAASLLLYALYHAIDVAGQPAIGASLGVNAIAAYALSWLAVCVLEGSGLMQPLYQALFAAPLATLAAPALSSAAFAAAFTLLFVLLAQLARRAGWRYAI